MISEQQALHAADTGAVAMGLAAFFGVLPDVAALLSVIWLALRIWETDTVQSLIKKVRRK